MKNPKELIASAGNSWKAFRENKKAWNIARITLSAIITAAVVILTVLSLSRLDFSTTAHISYNWGFLLPALLLFLINPFFKAANMSRGYARGAIGYRDALRITVIGNGLNLVLPFKLGEGIRLSLYPETMPVAERGRYFGLGLIFDGAMLFVFMLFAAVFELPANRYITESARYSDFWLPAIAVLVCVFAAAIAIGFVFKSTRKMLKELISSRRFITSLVFIALCWFSSFASTVTVLSGFSNLGFFTCIKLAVSVVVFINLSVLVPSTPGQLGLFELAVMLAFLAEGLTPEQGLTAGLFVHLIQYVCLLPFSGILWFGVKRSLNKAAAAEGESDTAIEERK